MLSLPYIGVLALSSPLAFAQGVPTSVLAPSNPAPIVYCPPERLSAGPPAAQHVLNVFLPPGTAPASGWPVVVATGYGGGASVPAASTLKSTGPSKPLWDLVAAGIAVVHFGTPGIGGGKGLWYPPGHPSGRYESFLPRDDNPEKSGVWALQWVKVQTRYPFDLSRIALRGSSGGAALAIRTAMGPDYARPTGSSQLRASTRVAAILAIQPPTSAWALEQGPELLIPFPKHLEKAAQPGVAAATLSEVAPELQKDYSLMRVAFQSPEARANNAQQALCLVYGDPVLRIGTAVAPFDLDATGFPILTDKIKQPFQHDSWFGYVFWKRLVGLSSASAAFHAGNSIFAMRDVNALPPPLDFHTRIYSGAVLGPHAARIGHDWLVARLMASSRPLHVYGPPPGAHRLPETCAPSGPAAKVASLEVLEEGDDQLVLGLHGPSAALVWLALARSRTSDPCGVATRFGQRVVDWGALLAPPIPVPLDQDGFARFPLDLDASSGRELHVQALLLEPGHPTRARWSEALSWSVSESR